MTTVYFATNRKKDGTGPFGYGGELVPLDPAQIVFAVTEVTKINLAKEDSGKIGPIKDITAGIFSEATQQAIVDAGQNLLVFIHGASNRFEDAIKRAAFIREWFAASGKPAAKTTVIAFTWPSATIGAGDILGGYNRDKTRAGKSGFHVLAFLRSIIELRRRLLEKNPHARVFLLAHSMGNRALRVGVESWFEAHGPDQLIFDQVIHAAPDEAAAAYAQPDSGFSTLTKLGDRITIYYNRDDRLMWASTTANGAAPLGWNGPLHKLDTSLYPTDKFRFVDCTLTLDYSNLVPWDASHQYYRRSPAARDDIVGRLTDNPRPAGGNFALRAGIVGGHDQGGSEV